MLPFHGKYPKLDPKSCVMPGAELAGDVELKEYDIYFGKTVHFVVT